MPDKVYVISRLGHPLMPCSPAKARHLLDDKKAKVVKRMPFTKTRPGSKRNCKFQRSNAVVKTSLTRVLFAVRAFHKMPSWSQDSYDYCRMHVVLLLASFSVKQGTI